MPFARPSLQTIIDRIISDFNNRVDNSQTFLRRSVFKILGYVYGGAAHLMYGFIQWVKDQLFITTADAEHLERHGSEYGVLRDQGEKATGSTLITGTAGTSIPSGTEFQTADGLKYRSTAAAVIGAGGTESISLRAAEVGTDYNQDAGTTLTFVSPLANVNSDSSVESGGITLGDNKESDEEYRARVLRRKQYPPHGGIAEDYITWMLEYPGVTRAWAIPEYNGIGTIGCAFVLDDEDNIFPSETTREAVRDYIESHTDSVLGKTVGAPVTAWPGIIMIATEAFTVNVNAEIDPFTGSVQADAEANLEQLFRQNGGPQETITISQMYEAITTATGEIKSRITFPDDDVTAAGNQVHVLGDVTWSQYS